MTSRTRMVLGDIVDPSSKLRGEAVVALPGAMLIDAVEALVAPVVAFIARRFGFEPIKKKGDYPLTTLKDEKS